MESEALLKLREQNKALAEMAAGLNNMDAAAAEPSVFDPNQQAYPASAYQAPMPFGAQVSNYGAPAGVLPAPSEGGVDRGRLAVAAGVLAITVSPILLGGGSMPSAPSAQDPAVVPLAKPVTGSVQPSEGMTGAQALKAFYPGNRGSKEMDELVWKTLSARGYTPANTLFATSTCPDEVNYKSGDMISLMTERWGESFSLGGLGGMPFVGKAGFSAYAHHAPDKAGKMLIVFAPHVGVEYDGKVGALRRANQDGVSTACGAAVGAYNAIMKEALEGGAAPGTKAPSVPPADYFDAQIAFIKEELRPRLAGIEKAADPNAFISYQMYALCREFFIDNMLGAKGFWDEAKELTVLGGIQINVNGGDRFLPLMFQTRTDKLGTVEDLYEDTFGREPGLYKVLGSKQMVADIYDYDLDTPSGGFDLKTNV